MPFPVAAAIGAGVSLAGMAIAAGKDKRQLKQQEKLQNLEIKGQRELMGAESQYDMWQKTGPVGQMEQMKKAGVNPALMYGEGGAGGATVGSGGNVTGGRAPAGSGRETEEMMGMGLQMGMMASQQKLMDAQARNLDADTAKKQGVDTAEGVTRIMSLNQGIQNAQAVKNLTEVQTEIGRMDLALKNRTIDNMAETVASTLEKINGEVVQLWNNNEITNATKQTKIEQTKAELVGTVLKNLLTQAQTANTKAGTVKTGTETALNEQELRLNVQKLVQDWQKLSLEDKKTRVAELTRQDNNADDKGAEMGVKLIDDVMKAFVITTK